MIDVNKMIHSLKYGAPYTPQSNLTLNEDVVEVLEGIGQPSTVEDWKITCQEVFSQLPSEDHTCDIMDVAHNAMKMNKPEMILALKRIHMMLEDMNLHFCNSQGYAASLIKETD